MNYNNWGGRRGRSRTRNNRNNWNWRGRGGYNRMPMLQNMHMGYSQSYQSSSGYFGYKPFSSPPQRKSAAAATALKPPSPLPGTEEYTQRNIQHASDLIKRQLNIDSDTCSVSNIDVNVTGETSSDDKVEKDDVRSAPATVNIKEVKKNSNSSSKQKSKSPECINVQEIYDQIMQHISNLSHSKKINLVNQSGDGYDIAIQQVQRQKRLELSRALRDMSKRNTQSDDGKVINAIIPDIGIKIEDLPKEVIADLSRTLHIDVEEFVEPVNSLVDPEAYFKQAEAILSVGFDDRELGQNDFPLDNSCDFESLASEVTGSNPLLSDFESADKLEDVTNIEPLPDLPPFVIPKPLLPVETETKLKEEVKMEETETDDFNMDIDFCIKNLDVHKSYLTCYSAPKQADVVQNPPFDLTDDLLRLPQIKVRTDLVRPVGEPVADPLLAANPPPPSPPSAEIGKFDSDSVKLFEDLPVKPSLGSSEIIAARVGIIDPHTLTCTPTFSANQEAAKEEQAKGVGIIDPHTLTCTPNFGKQDATKEGDPQVLDVTKGGIRCTPTFDVQDLAKEDQTKGVIIDPHTLTIAPIFSTQDAGKEEQPRGIGIINPNTLTCTPTFDVQDLAKEDQTKGVIIDPHTLTIAPIFAAQDAGKEEQPRGVGIIDPHTLTCTPTFAQQQEATSSCPKGNQVKSTKKESKKRKEPDVAVPIEGNPPKILDDDVLDINAKQEDLDFFSSAETTSSDPLNFEKQIQKQEEITAEETTLQFPDDSLKSPPPSSEEKKIDPAVPESVLHAYPDLLQKRWKSPGEKKMMIPNISNVTLPPNIEDNSNSQMENFDSTIRMSPKIDDVTMSILEQMEEFNRSLMCSSENQQRNVKCKGDAEETTASALPLDDMKNKTSTASPLDDIKSETSLDDVNTKTSSASPLLDIKIEESIKMETAVAESTCTTPDIVKEDGVVKLEEKPMKSEPVEKEKEKHRPRSKSTEKHHKSSSKSRESRKEKDEIATVSGSSYRKIKTAAEKKEPVASPQRDSVEQVKKSKTRSLKATGTQTDLVQSSKKGKKETARATQTETTEQPPQSKKAKKDVAKATQTDIVEPSKKVKKDFARSTQTDAVQHPAKRAKSVQTDYIEPAPVKEEKKPVTSTMTQTESVEAKKVKNASTFTVQNSLSATGTQTDPVEPVQPKKIKIEKPKTKNSATQSDTVKNQSQEIQAVPDSKSTDIQTIEIKTADVDKEPTTPITSRRKYAVAKLKEIDKQIENLINLKREFYELMLESDDDQNLVEIQAKPVKILTKPEEKVEIPTKPEAIAKPETPALVETPAKVDFGINVPSPQPTTSKETPSLRTRKRKLTDEEHNRSVKRGKFENVDNVKKGKLENVVADTVKSVDEVDTTPLKNSHKKERRKRKVEEEKKEPLNIKISLKNLIKSSPHKVESPMVEAAANKSPQEETVTPKQKTRRGRSSRRKGKKTESEDGIEIPQDKEPRTVFKIKFPMKGFRSVKKTTPDPVEEMNQIIARYSKDLNEVPCDVKKEPIQVPDAVASNKRRRSRNLPSNESGLGEQLKQKYDKRFFSCSVSLLRYDINQLSNLKGQIHSENPQNVKIEEEEDDLIKNERYVESPLTVDSDKCRRDISPLSSQMLDDIQNVVDDAALESLHLEVSATESDEVEFNTFSSAVLVVKVIDSTLLAGSDNGKLYHYNVRNGEILHSLPLSNKPITSLGIRKHEDKLDVYVGSLSGKIFIVEFNTNIVTDTITLDDGVQCMELSWDYLFVGTQKGQLIRYDIKKQKIEENLKIYDGSILAMVATQEGARRVLLTATRNDLVSVRDAMTGLLMRSMESFFYSTVYSIVMDKNLVYCGTSQHDIVVYTFQDGQLSHKHEAMNSKGVVCLKIVGNLLFAGCYSGNVYVYNTIENILLGQINGFGMILSMEIIDDKIILGTRNNTLKSLKIPKSFLDQL